MQAHRNDLSPLSMAFQWKRVGCVLLLAFSLPACITLPGAPSANNSGSGDTVQTAINSGVSALTDFFSPEVREFKRLVTEGKKDEALAFAASKEAFFEARYKANSSAPAEFVRLAEHVLATDWRPKLLTASVALSTSLNFDNADSRAKASAAWKASEEAQAAVEQALLYKITPVGRAEVASLVQAREALKARAIAAKPDVAAGMLEAVLESAADSFDYVGPLKLERSDFVASPGFQTAALARLNAAPDRAELERLGQRLGEFLSSANQTAADQRFAELVRQAFLADGRISLEELRQLEQMTTPITRSKGPLKGLVKVGLASLVRKTGTREFHVGTQKDLSFDLDDAADALLTQRDGSAFDFLYLLSVLDARVERETGSPQMESSRYRAGTDREINPAYEPARQRLARAEADLRKEQNRDSSCPRGMSVNACAIVQISMVTAVSFASKEVNQAKAALETTPRMLEKPRIASYQFRMVPQTVKKEVSGLAVLWDVKGRQARVLPVEHKAQKTFHMAQGVHPADENRSSILSRADKPQDADGFAREGVELSLSSLFAPGRLSSARKESAMDANAVLRLLNEAYERTAPKDDPPSVGRVFRLN